ncbi:hypothetical protein LB507_006767, partial [Fusarium sp. FIESC RH6]
MEAVGSVSATLQLAQGLGVTLLKVREAYLQIKDIDDFLHDFDGQLDATRTTLAILHDGIGNAKFDASTQDWWRQSELERLLRSCHQHYQRMNDIFVKIAHQRSSAPALRAWIRTKQYDSDISHLRLCINTCTNALQLPVIIHKIHATMQVTLEKPIPGEAFVLMEEVASRLTRLESSLKDTRDDLKKRAVEHDSNDLEPTAQSTSIDKLMESLELDLSRLTSSQHHRPSSAEKDDMEARLAQMQDTISKLRTEAGREAKHRDTSLSLQEIRDKTDMEQDTRSMLELVDDLVGSTKDYTSTIDSISTVSKVTSQPPSAPRDDMHALNLAGLHLGPQLPPVQHFKDKLENIAEWVGQTDEGDRASVISGLSVLRPPPSETIATSTTYASATTRTKHSLRGKINQRRIQAVEESLEAKHYDKAIDLLEIVLSDGNELLNDEEQDRLYRFMAKAIVEGKGKVNANLYISYPLLKLRVAEKECRWSSMQATKALDQGGYDEVLHILSPSQFQFEKEWDSLGFAESEIRSVQKIQLARGQSWFYARSFWDIAAAIRVLERLLEDKRLAKSDRAVAHRTLTRAYRRNSDYEKSKFHGEQAYQNMIEIVGRDDRELLELIYLMVILCSESEDPDRDVWMKMLPEGLATSCKSVQRPFKARKGLDTCLASGMLRYIHQGVDEMEGQHRLQAGLEYLLHCYDLRGSRSYRIFNMNNMHCWGCLQQCFQTRPVLEGACVCKSNDQDLLCKRHQVSGNNTRGFSIVHFFATATPKPHISLYLKEQRRQPLIDITTNSRYYQLKTVLKRDKSRHRECVDEISILLHSAERNGWGDLQWAKTSSIDTTNFGIYDVVNRPMDLQLPKDLQSFARSIVVTPVWAAALSGGLETVSFFLSLQETDAARGSDSILLLNRPGSSLYPPDCLVTKQENEAIGTVIQGVLEVFNTLPVQVARQLLSRSLQRDIHWCFVDPILLGKVLDKCGKDSADLRVWSHEKDFPKVLSESLLAFFFDLVTRGGLSGLSIDELKFMLQTLLKHSQETRHNSSSAPKSITVLIDHIHSAVLGLKLPECLKSPQTPTIIGRLDRWIDMLGIYMGNSRAVGSDNILKLRRCIDHLLYCKEGIKHNQEELSTISGELGEINFYKFRRVFGTLKKERIDQLLQRKSDLAVEKDNL